MTTNNRDIEKSNVEIDGTDPETNHQSKRVMIRSERHDTVEITDVVQGSWDLPKRYTVVQRKRTYYGPCLILYNEDSTGVNYRLTCPGPDTQLLLWQSVGDEEGRIQTWAKVAEVQADIVDTEQYQICEHCDEPLKTLEHERLAIFGACERFDDPNAQ